MRGHRPDDRRSRPPRRHAAMRPALPVHLCLERPADPREADDLQDLATLVRAALRREGASVSSGGGSAWRADALNLVLGGHHARPGHPPPPPGAAVLLLNTCPLDTARARAMAPPAWVERLRASFVADLDARHVAAYRAHAAQAAAVPLLRLSPLPGLAGAGVEGAPPLESRPVDLVCLTAPGPRARAFLDAARHAGRRVEVLDPARPRAERDWLLSHARAALAVAGDDAPRLPRLAAARALSLGTPVVGERGAAGPGDTAFADVVAWLDPHGVEAWCRASLGTPAWQARARQSLARWHAPDIARAAHASWQALVALGHEALAAQAARCHLATPSGNYIRPDVLRAAGA